MATIHEELEQIRKVNGGILRPEDVLAFAVDPSTSLHDKFEWDDTEAAHKYRIEQAREVIRVAVTLIPSEADPVRAYVSLTPDRRNPGGGYRRTEDVLENPTWREVLLADALAELSRFQQKYRTLEVLSGVFAEAERLATAHKAKSASRPRARLTQTLPSAAPVAV